ncbi:MAG: hypothetical protein ACT4PL_12540 [Phycisphaerales bacterium]
MTIAFGTLLVLVVRREVSIKSTRIAAGIVLLSVAVSLVAYRVMVLQPRMNVNLRAYWNAAAAGEQAIADAAQAAFSADHPTASNVLLSLTLIVGVLFFLAALGSAALNGDLAAPRYEEPRLPPSRA